MSEPKCAICNMAGYWVGWVDQERGYRCINHVETGNNDE